jgi:hypothetical protein
VLWKVCLMPVYSKRRVFLENLLLSRKVLSVCFRNRIWIIMWNVRIEFLRRLFYHHRMAFVIKKLYWLLKMYQINTFKLDRVRQQWATRKSKSTKLKTQFQLWTKFQVLRTLNPVNCIFYRLLARNAILNQSDLSPSTPITKELWWLDAGAAKIST